MRIIAAAIKKDDLSPKQSIKFLALKESKKAFKKIR